MSNRASDWFSQAVRDLEQAGDSRGEGRHEWACFAAHQAAEKAVRALYQHPGPGSLGPCSCMTAVRDLPVPPGPVPEDLVEMARVLDNFYIPTRYQTAILKERLSSTTAGCRARRRSSMPVRSLSSSVLKWPYKEAVDSAVCRWAQRMAGERKGILKIGYFGSYARGDWGVGSDLDLIVIVESSSEPMERRAAK